MKEKFKKKFCETELSLGTLKHQKNLNIMTREFLWTEMDQEIVHQFNQIQILESLSKIWTIQLSFLVGVKILSLVQMFGYVVIHLDQIGERKEISISEEDKMISESKVRYLLIKLASFDLQYLSLINKYFNIYQKAIFQYPAIRENFIF